MSKVYQNLCVLMYHGIVTEWTSVPKERETGAELYDVALSQFQAQMECLGNGQFSVGVLNDELLESEKMKIVLTFDDGEKNNHELAFPVLRKHGFPAYFFIIAKRVGLEGYMDWEHLREMHDAGMVIGSHGFSHEILTSMLDTQIDEELQASKKYLERNLGIEVDTLSIPRGFCDDNVIQRAYNAGYKRVFISERPRSLESDCYDRVAVKSNWPLKRFQQCLTGEVPFFERVMAMSIRIGKRVLGSEFYNWLRSLVLKVSGRA